MNITRPVGRPKVDFEALGRHRTKNLETGRPTRLYSKWQSMKARCYQASHPAHQFYKTKGIEVCAEWRHDFQRFAADMGEPPTGYTLERIDNAKGYEPANCRWATWKEQAANRKPQDFKGRHDFSLKQRALRAGIPYSCVYQRVKLRGWTVEDALSRPPL